MASTYAPYRPHTVRANATERALRGNAYPLLLLIAAGVFVITAGAVILVQVGGAVRNAFSAAAVKPEAPVAQSAIRGTDVAVASARLSPAEIQTVISYAGNVQPDDTLVQVRPGVFAKRSNVEGVKVNGTTVYYDIVPHQSYGPLRSGKLSEAQVTIHARESTGSALVLVYTAK